LLLALGPLVYYVLSLFCIAGYFRAVRRRTVRKGFRFSLPPASILKPVRGMDRDVYENFASYCNLDYPEYEVIFAVADPADPIVPVIERLQRDFPGRDIRLITGVERLGENNKVNNLCRLVKEAKYDFLVMSDSDVRVQSDYLREVAASFEDPSVGAVTAFYHCAGGGTLAAALDMLGMSMDSVPSALVARKLERKIQFAFGWTMATTKACLAEIGGWEAIADHHSDDFELGNRIAARGYRVELMRKPVWMIFPRETFGEFLSHELRWSIGLRNVRPTGYLAMIFTHGLPWALLAAFLALGAGWPGVAAFYLIGYLTLRVAVAWTAGVWGLQDQSIRPKLWLVPMRDALSAIIWVVALFTNKIKWRGLEYRVKDGLLVPVLAEKEQN
jgi:ceramide glucosyltransferase